MKQRCLNPANPRYADYGGQGIRVCERWLTFENFLADIGPRPDGTSLDRYPNKHGNYEPGNARWATPQEQQRNTRTYRMLKVDGVEYDIEKAAMTFGVSVSTISNRLSRGWSHERAVTKPKWSRVRH